MGSCPSLWQLAMHLSASQGHLELNPDSDRAEFLPFNLTFPFQNLWGKTLCHSWFHENPPESHFQRADSFKTNSFSNEVAHHKVSLDFPWCSPWSSVTIVRKEGLACECHPGSISLSCEDFPAHTGVAPGCCALSHIFTVGGLGGSGLWPWYLKIEASWNRKGRKLRGTTPTMGTNTHPKCGSGK